MARAFKYPEVLTVEEFARIFKLSVEAVRTLIRKGEIPAIRIGRQYRIPRPVVDRYFAQAAIAEERGFGMWRRRRLDALTYVNRLRELDKKSPEAFLSNLLGEE